MNITEMIFENLAPILYNLLFITLWILWFVYHRDEENQRWKIAFRKYLTDNKVFYPIKGILIVIFIYLLLSYAVGMTITVVKFID
jgi:hypothetical protein